MRSRLTLEKYKSGILSGNRNILSKAITVIESTHESDRFLASEILESILPYTGKTIRIAISGVPGVGKSTFIEAFGTHLTGLGKKVAVLAIDPTSSITKGSILGDKTRMEKLSKNPLAYIRPSPNNLALGGVNNETWETMLLCEAAGYEIIIIETVGVGQAEIQVKQMTDIFLLLMLTGAGDELQGIKKGIVEIADLIAINKADGSNHLQAKKEVITFQNTIHNHSAPRSGVTAQVMAISSLTGEGIDELWQLILAFQTTTTKNGYFQLNRSEQYLHWMDIHIQKKLLKLFYENNEIKQELIKIKTSVQNGSILPNHAADTIISKFLSLIIDPNKNKI
jgi:LAO/AO transport system kinase